MKIKEHTINITILACLALLLFWLGRLSVQYELHIALPPIQTVSEINPQIPLVEILDIRDAKIIGRVNRPEARIVSGEQVALPDKSGKFEIDIKNLGYIGPKRQIITHKVPKWARFIASSKGKYYYSIDENSANKLTVPNRVYFADEEAARRAGYKRRTR